MARTSSLDSIFDQVVSDDLLDDDLENESSFVIRGKWILDGADNLEEAADMARTYADFLDELRLKGYELRGSIEDDYGYAHLVG